MPLPSPRRDLRIALLAGAALACASLVALPLPAAASELIVRYDQSTLIKLPRPVAEVIIGNPSIADVAVQGGNMLIITGKSFGITNIIALDSERNVIQDQRLFVTRDEARMVYLHKGAGRHTYACTPQCNLSLTIGDDVRHFEDLGKVTDKKLKMGDSSAESGGQSSQ
jgi:hypothetical protein